MAEGGFLSGLLDNPWLQGGGAALGLGADVYAFIQQRQREEALARIRDILTNPQRFANYVGRIYRPMGEAESAAVNRGLSADWAARTGGAPGGAQAAFAANALAGIESQRYQAAVQSALQALTGATGATTAGTMVPGGNLAAVMNALMKLRSQPQPTRSPGIAAIPGATEPINYMPGFDPTLVDPTREF